MNRFQTPSMIGAFARRLNQSARAGFTLVEMMVALAIASLLLVALTTLFVNTSVARSETDKMSRQIESGRFALSELADDVRHAGYYGPIINAPTLPVTVTTLPDPCSQTLADARNNLGLPLQGYAGGASATALGLATCLTAAAGYKPNTAVLVIRRVDTSIAAATPTAGFFNIQVSGCAGDTQSYILDTDANPGAYTLHTHTSVTGCLPLPSAPAATITPLYTRIYFISTCSNANCAAGGADSVPTLKRIDIVPTATGTPPIRAIIDGIENMQFDYGIDTSAPGDGSPDLYANAPLTLAQWQNVMSVRIYLLARNIEASGVADTKTYDLGPSIAPVVGTGTFRRHAYSELVRINNPSGRRE